MIEVVNDASGTNWTKLITRPGGKAAGTTFRLELYVYEDGTKTLKDTVDFVWND